MLKNYLSPKAFENLRTEKQLGYVVFTISSEYNDVYMMQF